MTTWTPKAENGSAWSPENTTAEVGVFSRAVFSLAYLGGLRVFAIGASVWTPKSVPVGAWVAE